LIARYSVVSECLGRASRVLRMCNSDVDVNEETYQCSLEIFLTDRSG